MKDDQPPRRKPQGFAAISPERHREIARLGGAAVAPENRAFSINKELARLAGKKGGKNSDPEERTFAKDPELARAAGKKGGLAGARNREREKNK